MRRCVVAVYFLTKECDQNPGSLQGGVTNKEGCCRGCANKGRWFETICIVCPCLRNAGDSIIRLTIKTRG